MMGRDPFDIERNWDINWRVTESYGQTGVTMNATTSENIMAAEAPTGMGRM